MKASLIISEAGRRNLAVAGISTGWLTAWLQAVGAEHADVYALTSKSWKKSKGWHIFFASESELMRIALDDGRRIRADQSNQRTLVGVKTLQLKNPTRSAWLYQDGEGQQVLLLPLGEIAYQRETWLKSLRDYRAIKPLYILAGDETGEIMLEPGLSASCAHQLNSLQESMVINDAGMLPEEQLFAMLKTRGWQLRFAESCTAGAMSERFSRLDGASEVLDRAWITYSNTSKQELLQVPNTMIDSEGAVSQAVVERMVSAGSENRSACIAVSGIAGPTGATADKPVCTIWIAIATPEHAIVSKKWLFTGSRSEIRSRAVVAGFQMLISLLSNPST
ncbi:MAG: CinA family protein [Mariprofundaceae bacterium]